VEASKRWWPATVWLWFMVVANALVLLILLAAFGNFVHVARTPVPAQVYTLCGSVIQIVCVVAILRWRRWGWWGLLVIGLTTFGVNIAGGHGLAVSVLGLLGIGATYLVLVGGGESAAWPRLR
jgi:hypothetical protein